MMLFTKPEVHNLLQPCQTGMSHSHLQYAQEISVKFDIRPV